MALWVYSHIDLTAESLRAVGSDPIRIGITNILELAAGRTVEVEGFKHKQFEGDFDETGHTIYVDTDHIWALLKGDWEKYGVVRCQGPQSTPAERSKAKQLYERTRDLRIKTYLMDHRQRINGGSGPLHADLWTEAMMREVGIQEVRLPIETEMIVTASTEKPLSPSPDAVAAQHNLTQMLKLFSAKIDELQSKIEMLEGKKEAEDDDDLDMEMSRKRSVGRPRVDRSKESLPVME